MGKGTPSMGKRNKVVHVACRRCGGHSFHKRTQVCSKCGFGNTRKIRSYKWQKKSVIGKAKRIDKGRGH